jgi:hypothetical protein
VFHGTLKRKKKKKKDAEGERKQRDGFRGSVQQKSK